MHPDGGNFTAIIINLLTGNVIMDPMIGNTVGCTHVQGYLAHEKPLPRRTPQ